MTDKASEAASGARRSNRLNSKVWEVSRWKIRNELRCDPIWTDWSKAGLQTKERYVEKEVSAVKLSPFSEEWTGLTKITLVFAGWKMQNKEDGRAAAQSSATLYGIILKMWRFQTGYFQKRRKVDARAQQLQTQTPEEGLQQNRVGRISGSKLEFCYDFSQPGASATEH